MNDLTSKPRQWWYANPDDWETINLIILLLIHSDEVPEDVSYELYTHKTEVIDEASEMTTGELLTEDPFDRCPEVEFNEIKNYVFFLIDRFSVQA
jgi:hypothetical protein